MHAYLCELAIYLLLWNLIVFTHLWVCLQSLLFVWLTNTLASLEDSCLFSLQPFNLSLIFHLKILTDNHQVKSDLFFAVFFNSLLNLLLSQGQPVLFFLKFANQNRAGLKTIKFIEVAFVWDITHEVINIGLFLFLFLIFFEDKRLRPTKAIVQDSNCFGITQGQAAIFCIQILSKLMELFNMPLDGDRGIEQYRKNGLCGTCIVDNLSSKEKFLVIIQKCISFLDVFGPFEKKDKPVYFRTNPREQIIILKTVHFLNLNSGCSNLLDQLGKDSRIGFNSAPLIKHFYIQIYI